MPHAITSRDSMFTVRQAAWHGLGNVLSDYPTVAEAKAIAHPWEPVQEDVFRKLDIIALRRELAGALFDDLSTAEILDQMTAAVTAAQQRGRIDSARLNARSDDGEPLGVVSSTFGLVTNEQMYEIAEAIEGQGDGRVMLETGGSLKGGAKVWLLIRMAEPLHLSGDPRGATIPYYALQNAHDGSGSFRGQATFTRIVCDNTAQAADIDAQARGTEFVFPHTARIGERIEAAKEALAGWRSSVEVYRAFSEHMAAFTVSDQDAVRFLEKFIPEPQGKVVSDIVRENIAAARRQWRSHYDSVTCEGTKRTALGLVNASIEYSQHSRKRQSAESGFKRAYLDRSVLTQHAVSLARQVSGA